MGDQQQMELQRAIVILMTLGVMSPLDEAGASALADALSTLDKFRGKTVGLAIVQWQKSGAIRRDPRPAPTREVGGPPLRKREPFLAGGL